MNKNSYTNKNKIFRLSKKAASLTMAFSLILSLFPAPVLYAANGNCFDSRSMLKSDENKASGKNADNKGENESAEETVEYEQIAINNADDFLAFARECTIDSWSRDKYVTLKADIDLSGRELKSIPVFNGIFDGGKHTISGFEYMGDGYVTGLFRYVQPNGVIQNLNLRGNVDAENERECIGALCGVNYGTITGCSFQGNVNGRDTVGGLVGINESTGTVANSTVKGRISGSYSTGGIVGINHGVISNCSNRAGVNDDSSWVQEDDEMGSSGILQSLMNSEENELYSGVDTGGIAGYSDGLLSRCTNTGSIGYEHTGYNIGGIAGRQSGVVSLCTNSGLVYGRKDIGGIVGQMEPFIEVNEAESLRNAITKLHDLINKAIDDMDASSDSISADVENMRTYADGVIDTSDDMVSQLSDFVDSNVEEINSISERMEHIFDMLPAVFDDVSGVGDNMSDLNEVMKRLIEDINISDKIDNSQYEEEKYNRLVLLSTVGGSLSADSTNPKENDTVVITVSPDNGYRLKENSLIATDENKKDVVITKVGGSDDKYSFVMPNENVKVTAQFEYIGKFLVKSNAGGTVTTSYSGNTVTFKVKAFDNYEVSSIKCGDDTLNLSDDSVTLDKEKYLNGTGSKIVYVEFSGSPEFPEDDKKESSESKDSEAGSIKIENSKPEGSRSENSETESSKPEGSRSENSETESSKPEGSSENNETESEKNSETESSEPEGSSENSETESSEPEGSSKSSETESSSSESNNEDNNSSVINTAETVIDDEKPAKAQRAEDSGNNSEEESKNSDEENTFRIATTSSTGGTIKTAENKVSAGDKVSAVPAPASGYLLKEVTVETKDNTQIPVEKENSGKRYTFTMPSNDVIVTALFEPVDIQMSSNLSGNATYTGSVNGIITLNVRPSAVYAVNSVKVTDANSKVINVSKKQQSGYDYEFDITNTTSPCSVYIEFKKEDKKSTVDRSEDNIKDAIDELNEASGNVQKSVDRIKDIVKNSDGTYKSWKDLTSSDKDKLSEEVVNLVDYLSDMLTSASALMSDLNTIYNIVSPYVSDAAKAASDDLDKAIDELEEVIDCIKAANGELKGIVNYVNAQPDIKFATLGDSFDYTKESLHDQLKGLSDSISRLNTSAKNSSELLNDDLRAINDQLNVVFNLLADRMVSVEQLSIEELYEEVDDEDLDSITTGRVDYCTNNGIVKGDINVGGISGSMAIDDEDMENSAAGDIAYEIGRRFITKCLVTQSVNNGYITAKKDGAGGICGYMNHGIVVDSQSYGSVESTEGDYVGGICGESLTIIKRCYSLCMVDGNQNVGGIAGYGETIKDCYSMSDVHAENGRVGAIAGQIGAYEQINEETGEKEQMIVGNYYVDEGMCGIDDISYIGIAEPIAYEELLCVEGVPKEFSHLKVIYKVEDLYLGSEEVRYREPLSKLTLPDIPSKEGCYGVWPDVSNERMKGVYVLEAEYRDNVRVVQSANTLNTDSADNSKTSNKPYALVENVFTDDAVLNASISNMTPPEAAAKKENVVYEILVENSSLRDNDSFSLRLLNPYDTAEVYAYGDNGWELVESKVRGQYLEVGMQGVHAYYCVVNEKTDMMTIICIAAAAVCAIGIVVVIIRISSKRRAARAKKNQEK